MHIHTWVYESYMHIHTLDIPMGLSTEGAIRVICSGMEINTKKWRDGYIYILYLYIIGNNLCKKVSYLMRNL